MAHKKAGGSVKNLKDSQPKYRGVKVFGAQKVKAGNIIIRQLGSKYECGKNTYLSRDFTIHAKVAGVVAFSEKRMKRFDGRTYLKTVVNVVPEGQAVVEKKPAAPKKAAVEKKPAAPKKAAVEKKPAAPKKAAVEKKPAAPKKAAVAKKPAAPKKAKAE